MSSLIPGYEYDIFVSYRQKDNKYDGWVTEFVNNLKKELEATFKEDISLYFDINPHDGLLDTHEVDETLKGKLNSFVFIPIISSTYCDQKSFAWEHEFKEFIDRASNDPIGLKIKVPGGNVVSRVLPVRINELDKKDVILCESCLGGILRGIEFIYKSPGVSRPLRPKEEKPHDNLNSTIYRDQINKVAHAIKEIYLGMEAEPVIPSKEKISQPDNINDVRQESETFRKPYTVKSERFKWTTGVIFIVGIIVIILAYQKLFRKNDKGNITSEEVLNKAITSCDLLGSWENYSAKVNLRIVTEDGTPIDEIVEIHKKEGFYSLTQKYQRITIVQGIKNEECFWENDEKNPVEDQKRYQFDCKGLHYYREHDYCHFGLLMELKASGMTLEKKVETRELQGDEFLAITFRCDTSRVKSSYFKSRSWVVYIDQSNYSVKAFYRENISGTRDLCAVYNGILNINHIKMPLYITYFDSSFEKLKWIDNFSRIE